jgi:hypothetical protein
MKMKNFLYNQEPEEAVKLAYAAVSGIASKLKIKLRSQKDFEERMKYAMTRARHNRWAVNVPRDITSIRVSIGVAYYSPWTSTQIENLSYDVSREITDAAVSDLGTVAGLLPYVNGLKITITVNGMQAWRRQVKIKPTGAISDLMK